MKTHRPTPSAPPMLVGLVLVLAVAPLMAVLGLVTPDALFLNLCALVATVVGIGCLIYGSNAFFTAFDALAAKYLSDDRPAPGPAQSTGPSLAYPPPAPEPAPGPVEGWTESAGAPSSAASASTRPAPKPLPPMVDGEDPFRPKMPPLPTPQPKE